MGNMSYCRFYNTKIDMDECLDALDNREISSSEEREKALRMLKNILEFCESEDIIETFNIDRLKEVINECDEED